MKKKKEKKIGTWVVITLSAVLILSSLLSLYQPTNKNTGETINVEVQLMIQGQAYQPSTYEVPVNTTIYNALNSIGNIAFEQDNDMKCYGQVCNNFATSEYWQVFHNNQPVTEYNTQLEEGDVLLLYYDEIINFFNVTLKLDVVGMNNSYPLTIQEGFTLKELLENYETILLENNTINCLFNFCNNENNTWSVGLNNETVNDFQISLNEDDEIFLKYE